jgi:hemoglobin
MNVRTVAAVVTLTWALAVPGQAGDRPANQSLYTRLGGYDGLARFVDTAFPRIAGHPQLRRLFQGHGQDSQVRQRQLVIDAFCQATGGPCAYTGRAMKPVHTGLGITESDWAVFAGIVNTAWDELKASPADRDAFLALLERQFKADVVEKP